MKPLGLAALASVGLLLAAGEEPAPASAQPPTEQVGEWEVRPVAPGYCALDRDYAGGTHFSFSGGTAGRRSIAVRNPRWPAPPGGPYRLVLRRGAERTELKAEDPRWAAPNGLLLPLAAPSAKQAAAAEALEVVRADGTVVERLDLAGIAAAAARLPEYLIRASARAWPAPPAPPAPPPHRRGRQSPARPKTLLPSIFSDQDYPAAAIRAGEQGTVVFRVRVGIDGRVEACTITASSGSAILDSTTCRLVTARGRFEPARDRKGRPTTDDNVAGRIIWRLPADEPPPEEPPAPSFR